MTLVGIMSDATAGDPISGLKWSRKSLRKVARALRRQHLRISAPTVSRVLKKDGYSLRVNAKRLVRSQSSDRERQCAYRISCASAAPIFGPWVACDQRRQQEA